MANPFEENTPIAIVSMKEQVLSKSSRIWWMGISMLWIILFQFKSHHDCLEGCRLLHSNSLRPFFLYNKISTITINTDDTKNNSLYMVQQRSFFGKGKCVYGFLAKMDARLWIVIVEYGISARHRFRIFSRNMVRGRNIDNSFVWLRINSRKQNLYLSLLWMFVQRKFFKFT